MPWVVTRARVDDDPCDDFYDEEAERRQARANGARASKMRRLTPEEEDSIVDLARQLYAESEAPSTRDVEEMANQLLMHRGERPVGKGWGATFVVRKRIPTLRGHKYDGPDDRPNDEPDVKPDDMPADVWERLVEKKAARREDFLRWTIPNFDIINDWLDRVNRAVLEHKIEDDDIYNFDEFGYLMGQTVDGNPDTNGPLSGHEWRQLCNRPRATVLLGVCAKGWAIPPLIVLPAKKPSLYWHSDCKLPQDWTITVTKTGNSTVDIGLSWLRHFDTHTVDRTKGTHRLLIVDDDCTLCSTEFTLYCEEHKIILLRIPACHTKTLQPLKFKCFRPLRQEIKEALMRAHISDVANVPFLNALREVYLDGISEANIKKGFEQTGIVPHDLNQALYQKDDEAS